MAYSVFSDTQWLYPDSVHSKGKRIELMLARGGHDGAQILFDTVDAETEVYLEWEQPGLKGTLFQLLPVVVNENTAPTTMTTMDYESCCSYVTRKAPFEVYDALRPMEKTVLPGRLAMYLSVEAGTDADPGIYVGKLWLREHVTVTACIPVEVQVLCVQVPPLSQAKLGMLNFFNYEGLADQHPVQMDSLPYWNVFRAYVRAQLDLRCTHILLPAGEPVYRDGRLVDFDFSRAEIAGNIARQSGAPFLCGGHIAHWNQWDEQEYYPFWDAETGVTTPAGYLQLRLYFQRWAEVIQRNGWKCCMTQALADEPQSYNAATYRILAAICRKFLPGIPIIDAVETTDLGGAVDVWVPKQDTYEQHRADFDTLKAAGETIWFYTCAFPAGPTMNRSMDLPLTVSRTVLWMGARYGLSGFLHWGFNYYAGTDIWHSACCPHKGALLPAGDAHIVYPGENGPWPSLRFMAQRGGAEDYELLMQAMERDADRTKTLIATVCRSFRDYTKSGAVLQNARRQLLAFLSSV